MKQAGVGRLLELQLAEDRSAALPDVGRARPIEHVAVHLLPGMPREQATDETDGDGIDVVPPRTVAHHLLVAGECFESLELAVRPVAGEVDCRVALLAVLRTPPDGKNGVEPARLGAQRVSGEDLATQRAQRRRLHPEIGHVRLHVRLHPRRLGGIRTLVQGRPQRPAERGRWVEPGPACSHWHLVSRSRRCASGRTLERSHVCSAAFPADERLQLRNTRFRSPAHRPAPHSTWAAQLRSLHVSRPW